MTSTRSCAAVQKLASLIPSPDGGSIPITGDAHERAPRAVVSVKIGGTFMQQRGMRRGARPAVLGLIVGGLTTLTPAAAHALPAPNDWPTSGG